MFEGNKTIYSFVDVFVREFQQIKYSVFSYLICNAVEIGQIASIHV